jgi:glycosyltransferase involved in cell wall biosynthesis
MNCSLLVVARDNPLSLWAQIEALAGACLDDRVEVVIVDDASGPEVASMLSRLEGDVVVRRTEAPVGRRTALALAAEAAHADVCIALSSIARPRVGFVEPLVAAVRHGAGLAAPLLETAAGPVAGYRADADGSLWPCADGEPDALALDVLAATRDLWLELLPPFEVVRGHYELAVAAAAPGPLVVVPESRSVRLAAGPRASVVVCTQDRADEIGPCIDALVAHGALADGGEIVVVDNASADDTADVVEAAQSRHGQGVRLVAEPVPGLARARNTGAAAARNELLFYLDDDARPAPGWLEMLRDGFLDPATAAAGGPIHGLWPSQTRPDWPPPDCEGYFSVLGWGDADRIAPQTWHYGANWAVRARVLDAIGGFDLRFGAREGSRLPAEETEAGFRIARHRLGVSRYLVGAAVGHRVDPGRLDEGWLMLRVFQGACVLPEQATGFQGVPHELARKISESAAAVVGPVLPPRCDAAGALEAIAAAPQPLAERLNLAKALGALVASTAALGASSCVLPGSTLEIDAAAAAGVVRKPQASAQLAA